VNRGQQHPAPPPPLKSWIDNCIVPILLDEYLKDLQKDVANESDSVADSTAGVKPSFQVNK
jgi:hypothetical protein